jgi:hypothetical protein
LASGDVVFEATSTSVTEVKSRRLASDFQVYETLEFTPAAIINNNYDVRTGESLLDSLDYSKTYKITIKEV